MTTTAIEKRRERSRRHRAKLKAMKYGMDAVNVDMRGRHGNHARGDRNARWSGERRLTTQGYVAVRVPFDHPHGWGPPHLRRFRYAYEHHVVMMSAIGRPLAENEVVHHRNGDRSDNRIENLELTTRSEHAADHAEHPEARDSLGRFRAGKARSGAAAEDLRVREMPR